MGVGAGWGNVGWSVWDGWAGWGNRAAWRGAAHPWFYTGATPRNQTSIILSGESYADFPKAMSSFCVHTSAAFLDTDVELLAIYVYIYI